MGFIKERIVYEKGNVKVYINQCHNKGKKTNCYAVRRDDLTCLGHLLGVISWSGRWWQYAFFPEEDTQWNHECLRKISEFMDERNILTRLQWKKMKI